MEKTRGGGSKKTAGDGEGQRHGSPHLGPFAPLQALDPVTLLGNGPAATFPKGRRCRPAKQSPSGMTSLESHQHSCLAGQLTPGSNSLG